MRRQDTRDPLLQSYGGFTYRIAHDNGVCKELLYPNGITHRGTCLKGRECAQ